MAKSTKASGDSYTARELNDPRPPERIKIRRPMLGEVDRPSVGSNLETSSESKRKPKSNVTQDPPSHAPTTESPLPPLETETDATADSTATDGQSRTQQPSDEKAVKKSPPAKKNTGRARVRPVDESEFD